MSDNIHPNGYWTIRDKRYTLDKGLAKAVANFAIYNNVYDVIDIGCGNGAYSLSLCKYGVNCYGFDGNPFTPELTNDMCGVLDFSEPVDMRPYDMSLCLEVAEHIPAEKEDVFISNIIRLSSRFIIMSWAVEGQGGVGHVNCRNNDYVIDKMQQNGFELMIENTIRMRELAKVSWFKNTLMVFKPI